MTYNQRPEITKLMRYVAGDYKFSAATFANDMRVEIPKTISSNQSENIFVSCVKNHIGNFEKFQKDYKVICGKYENKL